jgi:hypothetical protein
MKPVDAKKNPGLAKLPTSIRNKMGYMKKGGLTQHPVKNGSKRMKKFAEGGTYFAPDSEKYTGDDEIVKYRMGQIKDPGVDLFKLVRGEEQVAKPVEFEKNKYIPNKDVEKDNKDVGEDKASAKVEAFESGFEETEGINSVRKPTSGSKAKVPVVKETTKTTITKVDPKKEVKNTTDDESSRRRQNIEDYNSKSFLDRLGLEAGSAYRDIKRKLKDTTAEDVATTALGLFPAFRGLKALSAGRNAFDKATDVTPKPTQIGKDVERITVDKKQIAYDPKKLSYNKPKNSNNKNTSTSTEFKKGADDQLYPFKKGGNIKKMASGGKVSSASSRGDGCAIRGKTRA